MHELDRRRRCPDQRILERPAPLHLLERFDRLKLVDAYAEHVHATTLKVPNFDSIAKRPK